MGMNAILTINGAFHSQGIPIAGWSRSWTIPSFDSWMTTGGTPSWRAGNLHISCAFMGLHESGTVILLGKSSPETAGNHRKFPWKSGGFPLIFCLQPIHWWMNLELSITIISKVRIPRKTVLFCSTVQLFTMAHPRVWQFRGTHPQIWGAAWHSCPQ